MANDDSNMDTNSKPPQGGTKLDNRYPDGVGEVSPDQPVLPSRQPISTSKDVTKRKK